MLTQSHDSDGRLLHDCEIEDCEFALTGERRRPPRSNELEPGERLWIEFFSLRWWEFRRRFRLKRRFLELAGRK